MENPEDCPQYHAIAVDNHNCRLGKWYDSGSGYEQFRHTVAYQVSRKDRQDNPNLLDDIFSRMQNTENASADVMTCIDAMLEEKHPHFR